MCPPVFVTASPFADLRPGAARQFEGALVARRLDDDVITSPGERVIKNEDAFFGCGHDEYIAGLNSLIHSRDDFPKLRRARRFRIAAPVPQEFFLRAWFQLEQLLNGAGFRVGAR